MYIYREVLPTKGEQENIFSDVCFQSSTFRADVRMVLEYLGFTPTFQNFKRFDKRYSSETPIVWKEAGKKISKNFVCCLPLYDMSYSIGV